MKTGVTLQLNFLGASVDQYRKNLTTILAFRLTLTLLMIAVLSTAAQAPIYEKDVNKAIYLLNTEQLKKAVELMEKTAHANASDPIVWFYLGYVQIKAGETDKAFNSFEKGTQLNDKEALNYAGKAYLSIVRNNSVDMKTFVDKALALSKSKNPVVLNTIAEGYLTNKQLTNQTLELLLKSQALKKENPDTQILLGDTYLQLNRGGESISSYERAASLDPKDATPHYKIGLVYLRSKNYPVAIESFNKAVSIDPNYGPAYRELGELYYVTKEAENAVKAQEKYMPLTENLVAARVKYAFYLFMAKSYTKANEIFKELIGNPKVSAITLRFYAKSLYEAGDFKQAVQVFDQYFAKAKPEEIEASDYAFQGKAYVKLGENIRAEATVAGTTAPANILEDSLAIESIGKCIALDSMQAEITQIHADLLFRRKRYPETIKDYKRLLLIRKTPSFDYFNLGRAYYYNNQLVEADSSFSRLIKLQPTKTAGYLWLARTHAVQDPESTLGLAKPEFEKLIEVALTLPDKNNELVEAYSYLGYYYYLKSDNRKSLSNWEKVLVLKPGDQRAMEATELLKKKK